MSAKRAWLVDASIYIFRAYFSLPDNWYSSSGQPLNAVYGYAGFLLDFMTHPPEGDYCVFAFDESLGSCYRNDIYPSYKASREFPDEDLAFQLRACKELTQLWGIPCYGSSRYEADDYLATLARLAREQHTAVTVVTRDKDLGQLIQGPVDDWWDFAGNVKLDAQGFKQKFAVEPDQFADYLALVGDSIDDIPGVPGVGPKTAAQLLQAYENLAQLKANIDAVAQLPIRGAARVQQRLQKYWPQLELARQLTGLECSIPELQVLPEFTLQASRVEAAARYLQALDVSGPLIRRYQQCAAGLTA